MICLCFPWTCEITSSACCRSEPTVRLGGSRRTPGPSQHPQHLQGGRAEHQVDPRPRPDIPGGTSLPVPSGHGPGGSRGSTTTSSSSCWSWSWSLLSGSLSESEEVHPPHRVQGGPPCPGPGLHWPSRGAQLVINLPATSCYNNNNNLTTHSSNPSSHHLQIQPSPTVQTVPHSCQLPPQLRYRIA